MPAPHLGAYPEVDTYPDIGTYPGDQLSEQVEAEVGSLALTMYNHMLPLAYADADSGSALLNFLGAVGSMLQDLDTWAHSGGDGSPAWSILMDINRAPDNVLPWLGQFLGVSVDTTLPADRQRQQIREHAGWNRGTVAAIKAAIRPFLIGTKTIKILERDSSPYHFSVATWADETPTPAPFTYQDVYDDFATYEDLFTTYVQYLELVPFTVFDLINFAILDQKPAGPQYDYSILPGSPGQVFDYEGVYIGYETYERIWDEQQTYEDLLNNDSPLGG